MKFRFRVLAPSGKVVPEQLTPRLRQILTNIQVAFSIEETSCQIPVIEVIDTTDAEAAFIIRILQRAGYDIEIEEQP